jgi:SAM-dependent methyltransferase
MDYTDIAAHYDLIMTSGYYNYEAIVEHLARIETSRRVIEIGAGTGLILERLAIRRPDLQLTGIDLTQAMLDIAAVRLRSRPEIALHQQNVVTLCLEQRYDVAFSYGGVWYFVPGENGAEPTMISHIRDQEDNQQGLERLAAHLPTGGTLLLGVQARHRDYTSAVTNGMQYSQRIMPIANGFRKQYRLTDDSATMMEQTTDYRTESFGDAIALLDKCGFEYRDTADANASLFLEFSKR